jgi:1-acyl-sn-glycerol-3-phosphate acyltransferase
MPLRLLRPIVALLHLLYGVYAVVAFAAFGLFAFLLVLLPLRIGTRRAIAHNIAAALFVAIGLRPRFMGTEHLPQGACVVVANHASYLDGIVLKAALPARFCFVIKKEVSHVPLAGLLLRRIGSEFVDRFNRHAGAVDTRRLLKAADAGQALAFFPEGTFTAEPGLGKFHTGAFAIGARANLPIVPVAIRGTRHVLPGGRFLPQPGRIEVQVLPAIVLEPGVDVVTATRDRSRASILAVLGEPDLAATDGVASLHARRAG